MRKLLAIGVLMLIAIPAWAQYQPSESGAAKEVTCDVKGEQKKVKSADECKSLGGVVIPETGGALAPE